MLWLHRCFKCYSLNRYTSEPIALTTKQTQENLKTLWNRAGISEEEKARLHRKKLNKL